MKRRSLLLGVCLVTASPGVAPGQVDSARWAGTLRPPGGREIAIEADIVIAWPAQQSLTIRIAQAGQVEPHPARELHFDGLDLTFRYTAEQPLECRLTAVGAGGYDGRCQDAQGRSWTLTLNPPAPDMLLPTHELAIALSAAPANISSRAAAYVLGPGGYERVRDGANGFACMIERPRPGDLWPVCFDAEGVSKIVPVAMLRARLRAAGVSEPAAADTIAAGFRTGRFRPSARSGVAFMLSRHAMSIDARTGQRVPLGPHVMFYAPYMQGEDVGAAAPGSPEARTQGAGTVGVQGRGTPHAYMIVRMPEAGVSLVQP